MPSNGWGSSHPGAGAGREKSMLGRVVSCLILSTPRSVRSQEEHHCFPDSSVCFNPKPFAYAFPSAGSAFLYPQHHHLVPRELLALQIPQCAHISPIFQRHALAPSPSLSLVHHLPSPAAPRGSQCVPSCLQGPVEGFTWAGLVDTHGMER